MGKRPTVPGAPPPEPGEGKRGEAGYIGYLLRQAASSYHNRVARDLADLQITPPQFAVMTMIAAYPGASNAEIARLALQTPQTVNVIVRNLERSGAVARRPHAVHGRIRQIELTQRGEALLRQARARVHGVDQEMTAGLSAAEERIVRTWLVDIAVSMTNT